MKDVGQLKVAIVHDWLIGGGAERVVYELHQMFPDAPIYTSYATDEWRQRLDGKVVTGWLQHFGKLRKFLALGRIWWFSHLDFSGYDLVISSSGNGEAFGIRAPEGTTHVCYCHSPTHYYWRHYDQYMEQPGFGKLDPLARFGLKFLIGPLRKWDLKASKRPDYFIANSTHIQSDIKKYYGRDSEVIFPPIDIARFNAKVPAKDRGFFVAVGRQVPQKFNRIIVEACTQLSLPLKVVGRGPDHERLVGLAGPSVEFLTNASDVEVAKNMGSAKAFIFAAHDDFGITPVEAMAAGTPVIAYKAGGALDYVTEGKTGTFFEEQTVESLIRALENFQTQSFDPKAIRARAEQFSPQIFQQKLQKFLENLAGK
jgi:glycosyltransferase involved in cell wall biosynthesis